ncbi:hypothetical protein BJ741DRAFT_662820 [Chytriomyces cf. hyalinus JEL632]|nr:hypothetical protein BJ741DRAFT_662820 [Chytriomyces cf. hyalinus JEL632]
MINLFKSLVGSSSQQTQDQNRDPPSYRANQEIPAPPKVPEGWSAEWSPEFSRFYFFNLATQASQWENPAQLPLSTFPGQIRQQQRTAEIAEAQQQRVVVQDSLPAYAPPTDPPNAS